MALATSAAVPAATTPLNSAVTQPARRVFAFLGDSNTYGSGPSSDYATGWRLPFQRLLAEDGIRFRCVGRGFGALNGTGVTHGRFPNVDDFHDAPIFTIRDVRSDGYSSHRISFTATVTDVNTSTDYITAPGNLLTAGDPVVLTSTGAVPTVAVTQPVYYACSIGGAGAGTFQLAQYEGGTTALDITAAGSGTITLNQGLSEMLPSLAQSWDTTPTDIIVSGGTNDIINLIGLGQSTSTVLATLQAREAAYEAAIDAALPNARKYRWSIFRFFTGAANQANCDTVASQFNDWLRDTRIPSRGKLWSYVDVSSRLTGPLMQSDGVHPIRAGHDVVADEGARAVVQAIGTGHASDRVPRDFARRSPQACVELRATTDRITIPTQASLAPGSNSFFYAIWYMPFELKSGLNVIIQQENPHTEGCLLGAISGRVFVYWKSAGPATPTSSHLGVLKAHRWHRLFVFHDFTRQQVVIYCNGRYVQRVQTTAAAITSQDGWAIGAFTGLNSASGLYQGFLMGHGSSLSIEDAGQMAEADYFQGEDPLGTTAKYAISEGTGTSIAGTLNGATAGTLSGGTWVTSGRYKRPCDYQYVKPAFDSRIANHTAAYTATYWESVLCDPTSAGFTVTLPTAVGRDGDRIWIKNVTSSTNTITVDPNGSETIDGSATATITTASGSILAEARNGNWLTV